MAETLSAKEKQQVYYGSVEGMPDATLRRRLDKARDDLAELTKERIRRESFTSAQRLAERLHRLLHSGVDCDFYYSNWPNATGCRAEFEQLAKQMEKWFENYSSRVPEGVVQDYPLGQLVALMEAVRFGPDFVYHGGEDLQ
jgi:hypothetical protein